MEMIAISLQSGSNGNCIYVESNGVRLLFDAGIPGVHAERRLLSRGINIRDLNGVIVSHDHTDHVRYAGVYQRKYGLPLYITPRTLNTALADHSIGKLNDVHFFFSGGELHFGQVSVLTIPTPHDGVDGSAFVIISGKKKLGIFTDLGHTFKELEAVIPTLDAVFIESNYDPHMLKVGPYPKQLKQRIQGPRGHLSNHEAAELLTKGRRLQWACLAHLSETNNHPSVALGTHRKIVGQKLKLYATSRYAVTGAYQL